MSLQSVTQCDLSRAVCPGVEYCFRNIVGRNGKEDVKGVAKTAQADRLITNLNVRLDPCFTRPAGKGGTWKEATFRDMIITPKSMNDIKILPSGYIHIDLKEGGYVVVKTELVPQA